MYGVEHDIAVGTLGKRKEDAKRRTAKSFLPDCKAKSLFNDMKVKVGVAEVEAETIEDVEKGYNLIQPSMNKVEDNKVLITNKKEDTKVVVANTKVVVAKETTKQQKETTKQLKLQVKLAYLSNGRLPPESSPSSSEGDSPPPKVLPTEATDSSRRLLV